MVLYHGNIALEAETLRSDIKNVEVYGSHIGLGANASVLVTVANTLIKKYTRQSTRRAL